MSCNRLGLVKRTHPSQEPSTPSTKSPNQPPTACTKIQPSIKWHATRHLGQLPIFTWTCTKIARQHDTKNVGVPTLFSYGLHQYHQILDLNIKIPASQWNCIQNSQHSVCWFGHSVLLKLKEKQYQIPTNYLVFFWCILVLFMLHNAVLSSSIGSPNKDSFQIFNQVLNFHRYWWISQLIAYDTRSRSDLTSAFRGTGINTSTEIEIAWGSRCNPSSFRGSTKFQVI